MNMANNANFIKSNGPICELDWFYGIFNKPKMTAIGAMILMKAISITMMTIARWCD
jgi:hypothetical protein